MGLKMFHRADGALLNNLTDTEIVAVPTAVMEDGKQPLFHLRRGDQLPGLLHIKGKGFVHHHMLAGVQRRAGQRRVRGVREAITTRSTSGCWTAASGEAITVTSGRSRLTFSSSREATKAGSGPAPNG